MIRILLTFGFSDRGHRGRGHRGIGDFMQTLLLFGLAGFAAQLVDGSLGMAFGVTATTTLVAVGTAPAVASAAVHLAEVGTALASGAAHWRFRNIDWPTVVNLAVPGALGAVLGAYVLTSLPMAFAEVWITAALSLLGLYVLLRFAFRRLGTPVTKRRAAVRFLAPVGLVAGFVDASGGGGWGPVATTSLLSSGRLEPRKVVGSVDTSEFIVALAASFGFLLSLSQQGDELNYTVVVGLMLGGILAAPVAAWLVHKLPARVLGAGAGGLIVLTNTWSLLDASGANAGVVTVTLTAVGALWATGLATAVRAVRTERTAAAEKADEARVS